MGGGTQWDVNPTWQALSFARSDPHMFSVQYVSGGNGTGAWFGALAMGDLSCNGIVESFQRWGWVTTGAGAGEVKTSQVASEVPAQETYG